MPGSGGGWLSSGPPQGKSSFCSCCAGEEGAGSAAKNRCFLPGERVNGKARRRDVHVSEPGLGEAGFLRLVPAGIRIPCSDTAR